MWDVDRVQSKLGLLQHYITKFLAATIDYVPYCQAQYAFPLLNFARQRYLLNCVLELDICRGNSRQRRPLKLLTTAE